MLQKFKTIASPDVEISEDDWEKEREIWSPKLGKEFLSYYKSFKSDVIHIKELREQDDGRSTLWIRLKTPEGFYLEPAFNISVYPENVRKEG